MADRPGVRANPRIRRSLITYLGAAALVLAVVAVGAVLVGRQVAQDEALRDAERVAQRTANLVVAPLLGEVLAGDVSRRPELDRAVANRIRDGSIAELNVWDRTGTVIYADDVAEIGERLPIPAEAAAAIDSGLVTSDVTTEPETGPIPGDDRFVEVYAPLRLPGQAPLAFEIYLQLRPGRVTANNLVLRIVPLAVGALLLLQLIQTPITVSLARRVAGHEAERAALLERALSASERERRQIAADLHDGVVQDLAGAGYALAAVARRVDGPASTGVEHVGKVVRGAVESLRRLMVDIYPPDLSGAGLPGAIDDLATPLRESGSPCTCGPSSCRAPRRRSRPCCTAWPARPWRTSPSTPRRRRSRSTWGRTGRHRRRRSCSGWPTTGSGFARISSTSGPRATWACACSSTGSPTRAAA